MIGSGKYNGIKIAPLVIFAWKRPYIFSKLVSSLSRCTFISDTEVFVFIDGPKTDDDIVEIEKTEKIAKRIHAKQLHIIRRNENFGLRKNIKEGVYDVVTRFGRVIVLEEDLIVSPDFLLFMNKMLDKLSPSQRVFSVSGWTPPLHIPADYGYSIFFFPRPSSWGWGTWAEVWEDFMKLELDKEEINKVFSDVREYHSFCMGGYDLPEILEKTFGKTWGIEFSLYMSRRRALSAYPVRSKCFHIGFIGEDTGPSTENLRGAVELMRYYMGKIFNSHNEKEDEKWAELIPYEPFIDWRIFCQFHSYISSSRHMNFISLSLYYFLFSLLSPRGFLKKVKKKFKRALNLH